MLNMPLNTQKPHYYSQSAGKCSLSLANDTYEKWGGLSWLLLPQIYAMWGNSLYCVDPHFLFVFANVRVTVWLAGDST